MSETVNRREFLRLAALWVPGAYFFPETWAEWVRAGKAPSDTHDPVSPRFRFMGRGVEMMEDDVVVLPDQFNPLAIQLPIHFSASEGGGHIMVIPGNTSLVKSLENGLNNQAKLAG